MTLFELKKKSRDCDKVRDAYDENESFAILQKALKVTLCTIYC